VARYLDNLIATQNYSRGNGTTEANNVGGVTRSRVQPELEHPGIGPAIPKGAPSKSVRTTGVCPFIILPHSLGTFPSTV